MLGKCICAGLCLCGAATSVAFMVYTHSCLIGIANQTKLIIEKDIENALELP
jgi:hypothetical protein